MLDINLPELSAQWLGSMQIDLTRYIVFAVGFWFVLWIVLAGVMEGRRIRDKRPPNKQLLVEFLISVRSIAIFSTFGLILTVLSHNNLLYGPELAREWGMPWAIVSFVLMVIGHDAYFYWTHRAVHGRKLFRTFHRRHHKSNNPSPFTAYSFDLAEAVMQVMFVILWMIIVPTQWAVLGLFMLHQIVRNTMGHAGYELFPATQDGKPMLDFFTTTTHHDLHHAEAGYNFGLYFTFWDRLMGTEHPDYYARFAKSVRKQATVEQVA